VRSAIRLILCVLTVGAGLSLPAGASAAVYLSPGGNDVAPCLVTAPCRTFDRAYQVAAPGDEVILAAGSYGDVNLVNLPAKASGAKVVFHPATGAAVKLGYLSVANSSNLEVRDVDTTGWGVTRGGAHVILRNVRVLDQHDGGYFSGADDVQIIGGEIGRIDPGDGIHFNNAYGTNTNIAITGLFMHDLTRNVDPSAHTDCVQTGDITGLVIRNSRFVNCATQGVFLNPYNGGATRNITIENTWFGPAQLGYNSLYIGDAHDVVVRNNSFTQNMYLSPSATGVSMLNNIFGGMDAHGCASSASNAAVFDYNESAAGCSGATHHTVNAGLLSQYVSSNASPATALDLHLKASAAAIDKGSPINFAPTDFDDNGRPAGRAPDIGAHEYGAGPVIPPGGGGGGSAGDGSIGGGLIPSGPTVGGAPPGKSSVVPGKPGLAEVLQSLPAPTAAAVSRLVDPRTGSKAPLTVAGFEQGTICRHATRSCRRTSTRLRVVLATATTLTVRFRQIRPGHPARVVRRVRLNGRMGSSIFRVRSRGLGPARYQVIITAPNGAHVTLPLRVR
jgi:hypothetical protein